MLTINWKKGKDKLVIEEDEGSCSSPVPKSPSTISNQIKSKKEGHKKF